MNQEKIEQLYQTLSVEQKNDYIKHFNKRYKNHIIIFSSIIIFLIIIFICNVPTCILESRYFDLLIGALVYVFLIGVFIVCIIVTATKLKWSNEKKVKTQIPIEERKKNAITQQSNNRIAAERSQGIYVPDIKSVIILDTYTEISDKLHAILNYQEIIQTRYYKFRVNYLNGSSKIITAKENSREYNSLISLVGQDGNNNMPNIDNTELILKYKKLLDEGIITQEEFNKKKKELL